MKFAMRGDIMPRKNLIRSSNCPYHVTVRCNNREPFPLDLESVWSILSDICLEASILFGVQIHALVLMPNHLHLLITTPSEDLGIVMQRLLLIFTKRLNRFAGRSGRVFGSQYHWTIVDTAEYFANVFKYVYRNPVRAGLCARVEEYRYSTLHGQLGYSSLPFPLYYPFKENRFILIPDGPEAHLTWLNRPFQKEAETAIRLGLAKHQFAPPKLGWKRTLDALALELY